jgi:hypothetical protein
MGKKHNLPILFLLFLVALTQLTNSSGFPASDFTQQGDHWYDNWGIDRTYYGGSNGYLPNLALESLGENRELAYSIGEQLKSEYSERTQRAVSILKYVQTWTDYGYDEDNVIVGGELQIEWAWNADEMAHNFDKNTGAVAIGDCEDMAFLCGTLYIAAGYDVAIVDAIDHASLLIWLPEFDDANSYWDLPNDDRDAGWIWVEATGESNPLGWTPPDYQGGGWTAHGIGSLNFVAEIPPSQSDWGSTDWGLPAIDTEILLIVIVIVIFVVLPLLKRMR